MDAFDHLLKTAFMPALETHGDFQSLAPCLLGSFQHTPHSGRVDCHRFLKKRMLTQAHGFLEMGGTKRTRRCEDHHIGQRDSLFVSLKPEEPARSGNIDLIPMFGLQSAKRRREAVLEKIGCGNQLKISIRSQCLACSASTAPAASDQGQFQGLNKILAACDARKHIDGGCGNREAGAGQKITALKCGEWGGGVHVVGGACC